MMRPTHAGGVVYRTNDNGTTEYLLVVSHAGDWVLPKGHIEAGETEEQAAVREIKEEAGVTASIERPLGLTAPYDTPSEKNILVSYFLLECIEEEASGEGRKKKWCSLPEAITAVQHEEIRRILSMLE